MWLAFAEAAAAVALTFAASFPESTDAGWGAVAPAQPQSFDDSFGWDADAAAADPSAVVPAAFSGTGSGFDDADWGGGSFEAPGTTASLTASHAALEPDAEGAAAASDWGADDWGAAPSQ